MAVATLENVAKLYVATFDRAPLQVGLDYWVNDSGLEIEEIAQSFFDQPETQALYPDGTSDADFVTSIYTNLFNRAPLPAGLDYWTGPDGLGGAMTRPVMILAMVNGALGTDADLIANKAEVGMYYAASGLTATDYSLSSVTADDATVTAAMAAIDDLVPFTLAGGITALQDAQDAVTDFLVTADGDDDPLTSATQNDVLVTAPNAAIGAIEVLVPGYTAASPAVRAALLSDEQTALNTGLENAQDALADAQAAVAEVPGLTAAVAAYNAAVEASDAADAADVVANAALLGAEANYEALNNPITVTIAADGTVVDSAAVDLIVENGDGDLVLDTGITEADYPGITALLNASIANEAAEAAAIAAAAVEATALETVNYLDLSPAAVAALEAVGAAMVVVTPADVDAPTQAEIASEIDGLDALVTTLDTAIGAITFDTNDATTIAALEALTADAVTAGYISAADKILIDGGFTGADPDAADGDITDDFATPANLDAAIAAAQLALATNNGLDRAATGFQDLVDAFDTAAALANDLLAAQDAAELVLELAQDDVDELADAIADLAEANANADALGDLNDAVTAAEDAFDDAGFSVPVTLMAGANVATSDSDIFLADDSVAAASITNFALLGDDMLFIGTGFTYNSGDIAEDGNNSVLEVFLTEVAGSTVITMETELWSSNSLDPENAITLTGVALEDVALADGFITVV